MNAWLVVYMIFVGADSITTAQHAIPMTMEQCRATKPLSFTSRKDIELAGMLCLTDEEFEAHKRMAGK